MIFDKKQAFTIVFYFIYSVWLLVIAATSVDTLLIVQLSFMFLVLYFLLLREKYDFWVLLGTIGVVTLMLKLNVLGPFYYTWDKPLYTAEDIWKPMLWATNMLSLRKLYLNIVS